MAFMFSRAAIGPRFAIFVAGLDTIAAGCEIAICAIRSAATGTSVLKHLSQGAFSAIPLEARAAIVANFSHADRLAYAFSGAAHPSRRENLYPLPAVRRG